MRSTRPDFSAAAASIMWPVRINSIAFGLADRACEPLRAADAENDAELDFRLSEFDVVGGDYDVALHSEFAAAAHAKPVTAATIGLRARAPWS
jgi:hypothetical protein